MLLARHAVNWYADIYTNTLLCIAASHQGPEYELADGSLGPAHVKAVLMAQRIKLKRLCGGLFIISGGQSGSDLV